MKTILGLKIKMADLEETMEKCDLLRCSCGCGFWIMATEDTDIIALSRDEYAFKSPRWLAKRFYKRSLRRRVCGD